MIDIAWLVLGFLFGLLSFDRSDGWPYSDSESGGLPWYAYPLLYLLVIGCAYHAAWRLGGHLTSGRDPEFIRDKDIPAKERWLHQERIANEALIPVFIGCGAGDLVRRRLKRKNKTAQDSRADLGKPCHELDETLAVSSGEKE